MAHTEFSVTVKWCDIYTEAQRISSYEGRQSVNAAGESEYQNVRITKQDGDLVTAYLQQSLAVAEEAMGSLVYSSEVGTLTQASDNTTGITELGYHTKFNFVVDGARVSQSMLGKMITEAIASHLMMLWLSERKSGRVDFYNTLFDQMITSIKTRLTRKSKPSLDITY